jgi:hypothetical protein
MLLMDEPFYVSYLFFYNRQSDIFVKNFTIELENFLGLGVAMERYDPISCWRKYVLSILRSGSFR